MRKQAFIIFGLLLSITLSAQQRGPAIQFINGTWYLYYSYSVFGKNISAIGVATNKTLNPQSPDYKWEDQGMIVESIPGRDQRHSRQGLSVYARL